MYYKLIKYIMRLKKYKGLIIITLIYLISVKYSFPHIVNLIKSINSYKINELFTNIVLSIIFVVIYGFIILNLYKAKFKKSVYIKDNEFKFNKYELIAYKGIENMIATYIALLGGKQNIENIEWHQNCIYITLKDNSKINLKALKSVGNFEAIKIGTKFINIMMDNKSVLIADEIKKMLMKGD